MAHTMLANKFAVGLRQEIKVEVAGAEGTFEQLLTKTKFEETKLRDIGRSSSIVLPTKRQPSLPRNERTVQGFNTINQKRCYNCNATGHFPEIVQYMDVLYLQNPMKGVIITRISETLSPRK